MRLTSRLGKSGPRRVIERSFVGRRFVGFVFSERQEKRNLGDKPGTAEAREN
jgi:hypothetical protein